MNEQDKNQSISKTEKESMDEPTNEQEVEDMTNDGCECCRHKKRPEEEFKDLQRRLKRIEGQVRGISRMVENDAYCIDILTQVSAATAALNSFSRVLLESHIRSCVAEDVREGRSDKLDELTAFLPKMMK